MNKKFLWFLFGLGSQLQIVASLSITELFVYVAAVILAAREFHYMKRNGVMPFFNMSIALLVGGFISGIVNHAAFARMLRGMAVLCLLPCAIIVSHWMLRKDMANFKWSFIGGVFSGIISTFIFQNHFLVESGGGEGRVDADIIMNGPLWLVGRIGDLVMLYPKGWYMQCPLLISAFVPVFLAGFALLTSVSGRGTSVRSICSAALVFIGGKTRATIKRRICNHFWLICIIGIALISLFKNVYQYTASSGMLGEKARHKYEVQTKGDKSIGALLLGGRMQSFCGLMACVDKPIIGFGPWALDENGYAGEFLRRFGNVEDYDSYYKAIQSGSLGLIPCHAYITEFWCWYGIIGLVFWLYVIFLLVRYIKQDCFAVPQFYMWLAASVPAYFWDIFFNPFSARVSSMMFIVACLMVRAVRLGRHKLPFEMEREILMSERR